MAARANLSGEAFAGPLTAATSAIGDNSTNAATTAFVFQAKNGVASVPTSGGTTTLLPAQYGCGGILVTGTLTSAAVLVVPSTGNWIVANRTTGAFAVTVQTASGTGVACGAGYTTDIIADGTNVVAAGNDYAAYGFAPSAGPVFTGTATATTLSVSTSFTYGAADSSAKYLRLNSSQAYDCAIDWQHSGITLIRLGLSPDATGLMSMYCYDNTGAYLGAAWYVDRLNLALHLANPLSLADGGTGAKTASAAKTSLGLAAAGVSVQWTGGAIVANGTYWFTISAPYPGTIASMDYVTGAGSFTANVQIAGASVTGLSAVAVSSATQANVAATAANTFTAGQAITVVIASATGSPTSAALNLRITKT